jgi:carbon storage regulator CsrA
MLSLSISMPKKDEEIGDGQKILIGEDIELTLNKISGRQVWLNIKAPKEILIIRKKCLNKQKCKE